MILTPENYHSLEARQNYMSASRYKDFCGSLGLIGCEARALAMTSGEWKEESTPAMLMSSYVDSHFSGTLGVFKAQNPGIFTQKGELKADFKHAETIIQRIERDEFFMAHMAGQKQVIKTAKLFGMDWSIMIDSYFPKKAIVDLKVMAQINKGHWIKDAGMISFVEFYGYLEQAAIYQAVEKEATGDQLPFYIAAASKEEYPDIEIIDFDQERLDATLYEIGRNVERIKGLLNGSVKADSCGSCEYCRFKKVLSGPIHFSTLLQKV